MSKTTDMVLLEIRDPDGRDITAIIREAYERAGSMRGAARLMGVDNSTLCRWIARLGLEVRAQVVPAEQVTQ